MYNEIIERLKKDYPDKTFSLKGKTIIVDGKYELVFKYNESASDDLSKCHGVDIVEDAYLIIKSELEKELSVII